MGRRKTRGARDGMHVDRDAMLDEVDKFHAENDRIMLRDVGNDDDDSDSDAAAEEQDVVELDSDIDRFSDDDEDEGGRYYADSDAEEEEAARRAKEIQSEENISKAWGSKKKNYYGAETEDFEVESDEDIALMEEQEAGRMQAERAEEFDEEDFEDGMLGALVGKSKEEETSSEKEKKKTKNKKSKKKKKKGGQNDADLLRAMDMDDIDIDGGIGSVAVERVSKDVDSLTRAQKLDIIMTESPLLIGLLEELKGKLKELQEEVQPLLRRAKEAGLPPTSKGISFLSLKFQLLRSYCLNVSFYLMVKSEGKSVKDHPVIKQLVRIRAIMDKIKPIESKLCEQVRQMLVEAEGGETSTSKSKSKSKTKSKRGLRSNNVAVDESEDDEDDDDDDSEDSDAEEVKQQLRGKRDAKAKAKAKAAKSSLMQQLMADLQDELDDDDDDDEQEGGAGYEEDNYMQLMDANDGKQRKKNKLSLNAFEDFDDFGDLARADEKQKDQAYNIDNLKAGGSKKNKRKQQMQRMAARAAAMDDFDFGMDEADLEAGKQMYDSIARQTKKKRKTKEDKYKRQPVMMPEDMDKVDRNSRRKAGLKIVKNRGLTRMRPKDRKTPHTRNRMRYEKAVIKRKSQVQEYQGSQSTYGGEKTGIKTHLTKSVKMR